MMPAHQIWSSHVIQEANFEKFLFCPNSTFNIRKSHKISGEKALCFKSYQPKTSWGWKTPPPLSAFMVKIYISCGKLSAITITSLGQVIQILKCKLCVQKRSMTNMLRRWDKHSTLLYLWFIIVISLILSVQAIQCKKYNYIFNMMCTSSLE